MGGVIRGREGKGGRLKGGRLKEGGWLGGGNEGEVERGWFGRRERGLR